MNLQFQTEMKSQVTSTPVISGVLQRKCGDCRKKRLMQRSARDNTETSGVPSIVHEVLRSSGEPLDSGTRAFMEPRFGHDFSKVRVHTDAKAAESARAVNAMAYTVGQNVVFGANLYVPGSTEGQRLLAHELTHVVQQQKAGSIHEQYKLQISEPLGSEEYEAEKFANKVICNSDGIENSITPVSQSLQRACGPSEIGNPSGCLGQSGEVAGENFQFVVNCDNFQPGEDTRLRIFAATIGPDDVLDVHGFASEEGAPVFNEKLSCMRAHKAVSALIAAGVLPHQIRRLYMHGATPGSRPGRRSVVIDKVTLPQVFAPAPAPTPNPAPMAPPAPVTQDCLPWQTTMLTNHLNDARTWLNDAEAKISAFRAGTASPADAAIVSSALTTNFHTTAPADVTTIASNFASLKTALGGTFNYECATAFWCNPNELAYVRGAFGIIRRSFDINVCPLWFSCANYYKRVSTLIHERAHQYPGATDNAYEWQRSYTTISAADAINNAESYAVTARQIYHAGFRGPGITC
ncbi:Uncharacterised protein [uncultured archaeon]|nr:Uncharacterised protein [uncultured archaeon]